MNMVANKHDHGDNYNYMKLVTCKLGLRPINLKFVRIYMQRLTTLLSLGQIKDIF